MCTVSGHYLGMVSFQRPNPLAFQLGFDVPMFDVLPSCDLGRSLGKEAECVDPCYIRYSISI